jgi:predicted metal-dependent hydrolase
VRIATPLKIDDDAVSLFAITKMAWIKEQQLKFESQERQSERGFVSGESHYYKGRRYLLNVIYCNAALKVEIRNKTYIDLYVRVGSTNEQREKVLTKWYRKQLKDQVPALIETKWGTCRLASRRIWLNLELAKKSEPCLEYIIVHEMIHLLERNHSDRFIAYLDKFMPHWRFYKEELNRSMLSHEIWG